MLLCCLAGPYVQCVSYVLLSYVLHDLTCTSVIHPAANFSVRFPLCCKYFIIFKLRDESKIYSVVIGCPRFLNNYSIIQSAIV